MPSTNPKIQAYIEPHLYQRLVAWKEERTIESNSVALNQILSAFFNEPLAAPASSNLDEEKIREIIEKRLPTLEEIRIEIQEILWDSGKRDFIEGIKALAQETISKEVCQAKEYWQAVGASGEVTKKAIASLEERLTALEGKQAPGLAQALANLCGEVAALRDSVALLQADRVNQLENVASKNECNESALSGRQLAKRLGCSPATLTKWRSKPERFYKEWCEALDPNEVYWKYDAKTQKYSQCNGT